MKCSRCGEENPEPAESCAQCSAPLVRPAISHADKTMTLGGIPAEFSRLRVFAGRYEIIELLGQGGMGMIFRVYDQKSRDEIAVKILNPEISADEATIDRFRDELKLARRISHKNICRMFDLSEAGGTFYIAMEYVPGESLKSVIRMTGALTPGAAVNIARQVAEGLAEAHRLGVVHRDLKPSNIMVDRNGTAVIMDFGIARTLGPGADAEEGATLGTPEYMSPEQAEGRPADERSDIYGLGIVLFEMLTGTAPFEADTPSGFALKQKSEKPPDPRDINPDVPERLSRLVLRCLEKDREKRPQSASEMVDELDAVEKLLPAKDKTAAKRRPTREKTVIIRRKTILAYIAGAAVVTALVLGGLAIFSGGPGIRSIAVLPFENANAEADTEYVADGITENIIGKLTQIARLDKVIARSSVFRYKGKTVDPQAVGRELVVDAIMAGRMSRRGDEITITVELIKVEDNSRLWGEQYRLTLAEIFTVEEQITGSIAENLRLRLSGEQAKRLAKRYTANSEAFIAYSKGSYFWARRTQEDLEKAAGYFRQAIEKDPNYALPYTGLAFTYLLLPEYGRISPVESFPQAKEAVLKSLALDSQLSEAHLCLAQLKWRFDHDWRASESEYKLAIKLDPGNAMAHHWYGYDLMCFGRYPEAIREIRRALELDPRSLVINRNLGQVYFRAGRFEEAREALRKTLEMDPGFSFAHQYLGSILFQEHRYEEALAEFVKEREIAKGWESRVDAWLGAAYVKLGQREKAESLLAGLLERSKTSYVPPTTLAALYFALGKNDEGFAGLERAYEVYDTFLRMIMVEPLLENARSDPRFTDLAKRLNLK